MPRISLRLKNLHTLLSSFFLPAPSPCASFVRELYVRIRERGWNVPGAALLCLAWRVAALSWPTAITQSCACLRQRSRPSACGFRACIIPRRTWHWKTRSAASLMRFGRSSQANGASMSREYSLPPGTAATDLTMPELGHNPRSLLVSRECGVCYLCRVPCIFVVV